MNRSLLALLLPTLCLSQNLPTNIKARFAQRDDFGSKLKVAYKINTPESSALAPNKNWMCANCEINQNGERTSNVGHETVGSTCGGYPNGCATVKPFNHHFDSPNVGFTNCSFDPNTAAIDTY
tara:strand:+ start:103 stop:471 length:369 start_codon:yes stop_codon:yes gene_type:complete